MSTLVRAPSSGGASQVKGAWLTATNYAVNDLVMSGGVWYACTLAHVSGATFSADPSKWAKINPARSDFSLLT
jgi:hypothetical protein